MFKIRNAILAATLVSLSSTVMADDIEGVIQAVDVNSRSVTIHNMPVTITDTTIYDGFRFEFSDLRPGMRVEIDYFSHDGKLVATKIERDD